ncbi:2'-5' RNA ligase family protein [Dethiothermospora halolimnae]|uniref:2'-5' RNA ligase family protein n=1 Tax=Dethiothermospora halolimnae TaxID=3114390 RepID=UPI003CCBDD14
MGYSIELYFNKDFEEILKSYWKELYDKGICDFMYKEAGRPHLALLVFDDKVDEGKLTEVYKLFSNEIQKFSLYMASIGVFPSSGGVSFIKPKVTNELLDLHKKLYKIAVNSGLDSNIDELYKPNLWVPHCTMTIGIDNDRLMKGLSLLVNRFKVMEGKVESIALTRFYPLDIKYIRQI